MSRESRLADLILEHPTVDLLATACLVGPHLALVLVLGHGDIIGWIPQDDRRDLYGIGGAVIAIIFSASAAAIAHYASASGNRARTIKKSVGPVLRRQWLGTLIVPGLSAFMCLLAMALDGSKSGGLSAARWLFEAVVILSILKFVRAMYLFQAMLDVTDLDGVDVGRAPAPQIGQRWRDKPDDRVGQAV
ncbi:hypothetical protein AB0M50_25090 [Nonomuraea fuscirosea]|uniref:hypothetical protein n=1 Tax=Nonomuraea fuscirosea TaxID=1291556 RepID=UPI0034232B46